MMASRVKTSCEIAIIGYMRTASRTTITIRGIRLFIIASLAPDE
jgi:hypothetical protein